MQERGDKYEEIKKLLEYRLRDAYSGRNIVWRNPAGIHSSVRSSIGGVMRKDSIKYHIIKRRCREKIIEYVATAIIVMAIGFILGIIIACYLLYKVGYL